MKGTRQSQLEAIEAWRLDPLAPQILWLTDVAGAGKSTVAKEVEEKWRLQGCLAGCFFFSRDTDETRTPNLFFNTIAQQGLAQLGPVVRTAVASGIRKLINPTSATLKKQCSSIFVEPLQATQVNVVLILDALDECEPERCQQLLRVLLARLSNLPHLKLFMTSRPEAHVREELDAIGHRTLSLRSDEISNSKDVEIYIKRQLEKVSLTPCQMIQLIRQAGGLFIWARTVCDLLKRFRGNNKAFINRIISQKFQEMNPIYRIALEQAIGTNKANETVEAYINTLSIIVVAYEPVTPKMINQLLSISDSMEIINDLGSVLECEDEDSSIRLIHPTFREFLLDPNNGGRYHVDEMAAHILMAKGCLCVMSIELDYDVCRLYDERKECFKSDELNSKCLEHTTGALQYSCFFWVHHILQAKSIPPSLTSMVEDIFTSKLLDWMYMTGVQGAIDNTVTMLRELISVEQVCNSLSAI
jgi:hypothetical protein